MREIKFSPPDITDLEIEEVVDTLKSGWITTGPKTKLFEKQIAEFCGTNKAVALNSQTAGMELILRVLGIGKGDEVIVPAYTYTATTSVVDHVGAKIVMVDCAKGSFEMDYEKIPALVNEHTKAIIAVDLAGVPANYQKVYEIAESKKSIFKPSNELQEKIGRIAVLADTAHSFGAKQNGLMTGNIADFSSFSFHAVKNLTTAEGGAVTWKPSLGLDDEVIYKQFMLLSLHGQNKDALSKTKLGAWEYDIVGPWFKCNMTDIMAAIGIAQLKRYDKLLARRKEIIEEYNNAFRDYNVNFLNHYGENHTSTGHLYLMRLIDEDEAYRNKFIEKMAEAGIACNVHYKPLPMMTAYKNLGFDIKDYPNAYEMYKNEVTLPLHTLLTDEDVDYVIEIVKKILKEG